MADEYAATPPIRNLLEELKATPSTVISASLLKKPDSDDEGFSTPLISDIQTVSSYNWLASDSNSSDPPTIQVPGAPPLVTFPRTDVLQLSPDSGHHFIDQNAARMNGRGMIPGLAACHAYRRNFNVQDYDIITDRNSLMKLFEFLKSSEPPQTDVDDRIQLPRDPPAPGPWRGSWRGRGARATKPAVPGSGSPFSSRARGRSRGGQYYGRARGGDLERVITAHAAMSRRPESSRINVDVVSGYDHVKGAYIYDPESTSQTLILTRWEPLDEEIIYPEHDFRGFGFGFLLATREFHPIDALQGKTVQKDADEVTGYHCLVEYKLFGKRILVRYHADGTDMDKQEFEKWSTGKGKRNLSNGVEREEDDQEDEDEESDTFDLLGAFKTLSVAEDQKKKKEVPNERFDINGTIAPSHHNIFTEILTDDTVLMEAFQTSLPDIPLEIEHTPNIVFPHSHLLQVKTRGKFSGLDREKLTELLGQVKEVTTGIGGKGALIISPPEAEEGDTGLAVHQRR
ncbi:hypothetical protein ABW21_db0207978 [Orbilia brochopaga]|nr:hypothetical protein ABW21_db0207978 [Drechslerella brochopaga]